MINENIDLSKFWEGFKAALSELFDIGCFNDLSVGKYLPIQNLPGNWRFSHLPDHKKINKKLMQEVGNISFPFAEKPESNEIIILIINFFYKYAIPARLTRPGRKRTLNAKNKFRYKINNLFNNLDIPLEFRSKKVCLKVNKILQLITDDIFKLDIVKENEDLRKLLEDAEKYFSNPKHRNINDALIKIVGALERSKTISKPSNKKESIEDTIELIAKEDRDVFKYLDEKLNQVRVIYNTKFIRHTEMGQVKIPSDELKEFLFWECYNLIRLILKALDSRN